METAAFFPRRGTPVVRCTAIVASIAFAALALSVSGCGGSDQMKKQVSALETQLTAMRADQDRLEERLSALEIASPVASRERPAPTAKRAERPRLKVIQLAPEGPEGPAEEPATPATADDPAGRRPIIRGTGDRVIKIGDPEQGAESSKVDSLTTKPIPLAALARDARED